MISHHINFLHS